MLLKRVDVQPTEKPSSVGPHKSKSKTTTNKEKSHVKNKKFKSVSTQLREGSTKPDNYGTNILLKHLFYKHTQILRTIHSSILVQLFQTLPGNLQKIANTLLAIDSSLVIHCILGIIRGQNLTLNHQIHQQTI